MDNRITYKLVEEVEQRCRFVDLAFQQLCGSLNEQVPERVFFYTHGLVDHLAALNGLLWPKRQSSQERGTHLRTELKIADSSAININTFRSQLTAEDESFEDWLTGLRDPNYVDFNLMPASTITGFSSDTFHRNLDPETLKFSYRGATCDLKHAHVEVVNLLTIIERWKREHTPW
jgi:hypothetical protein